MACLITKPLLCTPRSRVNRISLESTSSSAIAKKIVDATKKKAYAALNIKIAVDSIGSSIQIGGRDRDDKGVTFLLLPFG